MRTINKQGKNYENYFRGRLVKSLRKVKHFVDEYYSCEDFEKATANLIKVVRNHFSLVEVLRNLGFYPEDYKHLDNYLWYPYQEIGLALRDKSYWDVPLNSFLSKNKNVAPFDDYLQEDSLQLSFNFRN